MLTVVTELQSYADGFFLEISYRNQEKTQAFGCLGVFDCCCHHL